MDFSVPPVWHRRSTETPAAFIAFGYFRDLGPGRTVNAAFRVAKGRTGADGGRTVRAHSRWYAWAEENAWVERAEAYDAHVDAEVTRANVGNIAAARRQSEETAILLQSKIAGDIYSFPSIVDPQTGKVLSTPSMPDRLQRAQTLSRLAVAYRYATMTRLMAIGAPREELDKAGVSVGTGGGRLTLSAVWEDYEGVLEEDEPLAAGEEADEPA